MPPPPILTAFLSRCGIPAARVAVDDVLERYCRDLAAANSAVNLTRLTAPADFWIKHVADSLAIGLFLPQLLTAPCVIADVGSGAGFPLIPLAWANPAARLTGLEVNHKKTAFLEAEIATLGLTNCAILARQAREAGRLPEHAGRYDFVVSRAVGAPEILVRDCRQLLRPGAAATLVLYGTPASVGANHRVATREAAKFGLSLILSPPLELPEEAGQRQFMCFRRP